MPLVTIRNHSKASQGVYNDQKKLVWIVPRGTRRLTVDDKQFERAKANPLLAVVVHAENEPAPVVAKVEAAPAPVAEVVVPDTETSGEVKVEFEDEADKPAKQPWDKKKK